MLLEDANGIRRHIAELSGGTVIEVSEIAQTHLNECNVVAHRGLFDCCVSFRKAEHGNRHQAYEQEDQYQFSHRFILQKNEKKIKQVPNFNGFQYNKSMGTITELKEGARNKERVNVYMDGEFAFAVYIDTAIANRLKKGAELSDDDVERILREDKEKYALSCAMKFLSYRMRTERELRRKLKEKEIAPEAIDAAVAKLKEIGYLDDQGFAELYAQELMQKYGQRVAMQKLMQKGVPREIAQETLAGMEQEETVIDTYVVRLKQKHAGEEENKAKQKIIRALMAKGFDYEDIKRALRRDEEQ